MANLHEWNLPFEILNAESTWIAFEEGVKVYIEETDQFFRLIVWTSKRISNSPLGLVINVAKSRRALINGVQNIIKLVDT